MFSSKHLLECLIKTANLHNVQETKGIIVNFTSSWHNKLEMLLFFLLQRTNARFFSILTNTRKFLNIPSTAGIYNSLLI